MTNLHPSTLQFKSSSTYCQLSNTPCRYRSCSSQRPSLSPSCDQQWTSWPQLSWLAGRAFSLQLPWVPFCVTVVKIKDKLSGECQKLRIDVSVVSKLSGWLFNVWQGLIQDMTRPARSRFGPSALRNPKAPIIQKLCCCSSAAQLSASLSAFVASLLSLVQFYQHGSYKANRP